MRLVQAMFLGAVVATALAAAQPAMSAADTQAMSRLPPKLTQGQVTYMSGGIGEDEAAAMKQESSHYPLSLEFAQRGEQGNEYIAGVVVDIKNMHGRTELSTISDGPLLLADLPAGKYKLTVDLNGQTKTRDVVIAQGKPAHVVFVW